MADQDTSSKKPKKEPKPKKEKEVLYVDDPADKKCSVVRCTSPCFIAPIRHVVVVFCFFLIIILYGQRVSLSIAIVEMVEQTDKPKNQSKSSVCPVKTGEQSVIKKIEGGKIKWSEQEQSYVLMSFYIGYTIFQIPGGYLCDKYGAKYLVIASIFFSSLTTVVLPVMVMNKLSWIVICTVRAIGGIAQSVLYPGVTSLLSRWAPPNERGTLGGVTYSGNSFGTVIGTMFSGLAIHYLKDWTVVFYTWAAAGFIWCPLFCIWGASDPSLSKIVTKGELEYIQERITKQQKRTVPLKKIFQDSAVWAIIICQIGHDYLFFTMITNLPKYMNNVLNYNIQSNAFLSSMPFVAQYISSILFGKILDVLVLKYNLRIEFMRKLYTTFAALFPGGLLVVAGLANCNRVVAQVCIVCAMFCKGPFYSSLKINGMDLTTNYAGNIMSITNGIGSLAGIATPFVIGILAPNNTFQEWHMVFGIVFSISASTCIIYDIIGKADRALWDYEEDETLPPKIKRKKWYLQSHPEDTIIQK